MSSGKLNLAQSNPSFCTSVGALEYRIAACVHAVCRCNSCRISATSRAHWHNDAAVASAAAAAALQSTAPAWSYQNVRTHVNIYLAKLLRTTHARRSCYARYKTIRPQRRHISPICIASKAFSAGSVTVFTAARFSADQSCYLCETMHC